MDGFIVLDIVYDINNNVCFSLFTSTVDNVNDVSTWHAQLGHISQQHMQITR